MEQKVRFGFGIFQKILLATLCVSLIPLGIIWAIDSRSTETLATISVERQLSSFSGKLASQVDDWVDMNLRMLRQNAATEALSNMEADQQDRVLKTIPDQYDWIYLAFTTDLDGNNIGRSDGKQVKFYGDRSYFRQIKEGAPFGKQVLIGKTSGKPALVLSTPILDHRSKRSGMIAIAMTLTDLSKGITETRIGKTGSAFLLDGNGEVIAHRSEKFTQSRADFSKHPALLASQQGKNRLVYTDEEGVGMVAAMTKTAHGWTVITQQEQAEAFAPVRAANSKALILLVVTLVLVVGIALFLAQKLSAPIRSLTRTADQYSQGKLDVTISGLARKDEIGDLARAVERLGTSIRVAMQRLRKKAA